MFGRRALLLLLLAFWSASADAAANDTVRNSLPAKESIVITVAENGGITLQSESLAKADLVTRLHTITQSKLTTPIAFYVDRNVSYGRIIEAMGLVSAAGYSDVKLEPPPR